MSVLGRHASGDIEFDLFFEMKAEFGSQFAFNAALAKQGKKTESKDLGHWLNLNRPLAHTVAARSKQESTLSRLQNLSYGPREPLPVRSLQLQLFPAASGKPVILGLPVIVRIAPLCVDPASLLQPVQCRIQRALLYLQHVLGDLLDAQRNAPAVHGLERQGFQNEQVERALQ